MANWSGGLTLNVSDLKYNSLPFVWRNHPKPHLMPQQAFKHLQRRPALIWGGKGRKGARPLNVAIEMWRRQNACSDRSPSARHTANATEISTLPSGPFFVDHAIGFSKPSTVLRMLIGFACKWFGQSGQAFKISIQVLWHGTKSGAYRKSLPDVRDVSMSSDRWRWAFVKECWLDRPRDHLSVWESVDVSPVSHSKFARGFLPGVVWCCVWFVFPFHVKFALLRISSWLLLNDKSLDDRPRAQKNPCLSYLCLVSGCTTALYNVEMADNGVEPRTSTTLITQTFPMPDTPCQLWWNWLDHLWVEAIEAYLAHRPELRRGFSKTLPDLQFV